MRPMFICIEGGEGSGKTTMTAAVTAWLTSKGRKVKEVGDPGSTPLAQRLREIVVSKDIPCSPEQQALLYVAARSALGDEVKQMMKDGFDVVCGRWTLSTLVYQGLCGGAGLTKVRQLAEQFIKVNPDIYIVLDATPDLALARKRAAVGDHDFEKDRFDSRGMDWHNRVCDCYAEMARTHEYPIVDADKPLLDVEQAVIAICQARMGI